MYHRRAEKQMTFFDFDQGFGFPIDQNNRWVELSRQIPWDEAEESYAKNFASKGSFETGNVALSFRIALGSLIIKEVLHQSDRGTVKAIQENPYLQYFLGVEKYTSEPLFDPSMMTHFRKRLDLESMKEINDLVIKFKKKITDAAENTSSVQETPDVQDGSPDKPADGFPCRMSEKEIRDSISEAAEAVAAGVILGAKTLWDALTLGYNAGSNKGTLIIDATCCPVKIRYPQDFSLLNEAREKLEAVISRICRDCGLYKPRTYCRKLREVFLDLSKKKRRKKKEIRSVIRRMLHAVKRNLDHIENFQEYGYCTEPKEDEMIKVIRELYQQQKEMFDSKSNRCDHRIVSLQMPFIRPIVRGKVPVPTEFGPKIDLGVDEEGNSRVEFFSYEAYNESGHLIEAIEAYKERSGHYPMRVLADRIYRNSENIAFCKKNNILLSGPKLGRPSKDPDVSRDQKLLEKQDMIDRIEVERKFSRAKRVFCFDEIPEKTEETIGSVIGLSVLLDNLIPVGF